MRPIYKTTGKKTQSTISNTSNIEEIEKKRRRRLSCRMMKLKKKTQHKTLL
jgi:hypothetical protein